MNLSTKFREARAAPRDLVAMEPGGADLPVPSRGLMARLKKQAGRSALWIVLVDLICIGTFAGINSAFVSGLNLTNLALSGTEVVLLAVAEALLLTAGEFDISLGANLVLSSVVGSQLLVNLSGSPQEVQASLYPHIAVGAAVGIVACLLTGCAIGVHGAPLGQAPRGEQGRVVGRLWSMTGTCEANWQSDQGSPMLLGCITRQLARSGDGYGHRAAPP